VQRYRYDSRARIQRVTHGRRHEKTLNVSGHEWLSFQHHYRLAQRTFVHTHRPCSSKCKRLATTIAKIRFLTGEDPRSIPTLFTCNSKSSLLNTGTTDYTDLRIGKREDCIVEIHIYNQKRPPRIRGGRKFYQTKSRLLFVVAQHPALLQVLAANAVSRPRHCIETFLRQCFTAVNTLAVTGSFDPFEGFVD